MVPYIDIHTHAWPQEDPARRIFRAFHQQEQAEFHAYTRECSVGLHPWFLEPEAMDAQWAWLEVALSHPRVRMLGEAGLDRLRGPELAFQEQCFDRQLKLAERLQKPVVIHCVRAFEELKRCVEQRRPAVPLILHGFNRNEKLLLSLLPFGFYVSFGAAILHPESVAASALQAAPLERLLLETDDSGIPIERIYAAAAGLRSLSLDTLKTIIWNNCKQIGLV